MRDIGKGAKGIKVIEVVVALVALLVGTLGVSPPASSLPEAKAKPSLRVVIKGLPKGTPAVVTVKGPARYKKKLTATRTLKRLAPGTYKVIAKAVPGNTFAPAKTKQTVTVSGGRTAVTVKYVRRTTPPPPPPPPPSGGPEITTTSLPSGMVGASYYAPLSRTQGGVPFDEGSWGWTAAQAPPGLAMDEWNGTIFGTPTTAGTYTFTVTFAGGGRTASRNLTLVVAPPPAAETWKQVSAGIATRCGIKTDDTAWCWGLGEYGDLGNGASGPGANSFLPVRVAGGGTWTSIDVGGYTCGIKTGGTAWCWGWNFYGSLGNGTTTDASVPVQVSGGGTWTAVDAGYTKSCGIKSDGTAWCWGAGQIGNGVDGSALSPVQALGGDDWVSITVGTPGGQAGDDHTCATKSDGSAWCWGQGYYGALGIGPVSQSDAVREEPTAVDSTEAWTQLVGGARHTCGLADDQALWCWGASGDGQLGTSLLASNMSPDVVVEEGPWRAVGPGERHTCGTKTDNTGWCWGTNGFKQLGPATSAAESFVPLQVPGSWAGLDAGDFATCGVRTDGKAFCWGKSWAGGLGDVSTTDSATPVPVLG